MKYLNKYCRRLIQQTRQYRCFSSHKFYRSFETNIYRIKGISLLKRQKNNVFSSITNTIKANIDKRLNIWLARRIPKHREQQINYRNIFIIPTRFGGSLMVFMLLLFLLGTNYQNNVIILISYLLVSFFIVVLHHSFLNLSGLRFQAKNAIQGFVGSKQYFPVLVNSKKSRFNIQFSFEPARPSVDNRQTQKQSIDLTKLRQTSVVIEQIVIGDNLIRVPYFITQRGEYALGRVLIKSEFGFGLFKTWTRLDFAQQVTAYPKPVEFAWEDTQQGHQQDDEKNSMECYQDSFESGHDEFHQLQHYQQGEPFSRVAWKQVARGQGWLTKQYQQAHAGKLQLDFDHLPSGSLEQRLSWLCYAVKYCNDKQIAFSLKLPDQVFEFGHGSQHTSRCLTALARY